MQFLFECSSCGYTFVPTWSHKFASGGAWFVDCSTQCEMPGCGGEAFQIQSGFYTLLDGVVQLAQAPAATKHTIQRVKETAEKFKSGEISQDEAVGLIAKYAPILAIVLRQAQGSITWDRLIAALGLLLAFWSQYSSDHAVRAALEESQKQTELTRKIAAELQEQTASLKDLSRTKKTQLKKPAKGRPASNRAQKRKAAAIERRKGKKRGRPAD